MIANKPNKTIRDCALIMIAQSLLDNALDYHDFGNDEIVIVMDGGDVWLCDMQGQVNLDCAKTIERII